LTLAPVVTNVATRAVTGVPKGTITEIVLAASFTVPVAIGLENEKAVIALAELIAVAGTAALPPPPPPQAVISAMISVPVIHRNAVLIFSSNLISFPF
jgi:hypothetical protein